MRTIFLSALIIFFDLQISKAQWIQQNSGTNQNLYDIEFINDKTGWAVGDAGVVIKTTNGGINWLNVPNPSGQYGGLLWSVCPVDSEVVYVVAGYDFIMKTSNGGTNWNVLSGRPSSITAFKAVYFLNRDTGWFLGSYKVFRTYNGGITLDSFYAPWFTNSDIYFKDIDTGIFCGDGRVFKSTDGGMNWFNTNVPTGMFYMFRKLGVYNSNVWIVGSSSPVFRSTDFCNTWDILTPGQQIGGVGLHFINDSIGFIGRSLNNLIATTNGGYNWYQQQTDPTSTALILSISFTNDTIGWYVAGAGRIYKTTTGGQWLTKVNSISNSVTDNFSLSQNYPNPFNGETNIEFEINESSDYKLEIFNIMGKKIEELFNKKFISGIYNIRYVAENVTSGIYFYKLSSDKYSTIKKFILLK